MDERSIFSPKYRILLIFFGRGLMLADGTPDTFDSLLFPRATYEEFLQELDVPRI